MLSKNFNTYSKRSKLYNKQNLLRYCDLYGYSSDEELSELIDALKDKKMKRLHIDMYADNPHILFLKTDVKDAEIISDENRFIISSGNINKSTIVNIFKNDIEECIYKRYGSNRFEIIFSLGNILYRLLATMAA